MDIPSISLLTSSVTERLDPLGDSRHLGKIVADDVLGVGQIVAQRFDILADGADRLFGRKAELPEKRFVFEQNLQFVGKLEAGEQRGGLIAPLPFRQQQVCLGQPSFRDQRLPLAVGPEPLNQWAGLHLHHGDDAK